jgi:WS/DGAT/MGAT family acyltransferase
MWRAERDPRTRSSGVLLEILESEPDWDRLVAAHKRVTDEIPRLRDRIVEPAVPVTQPIWSPDPDFDLDDHLFRVALPHPSTHRQLLDLCEEVLMRPFAPGRPPWEATLVTGLEEGKAAYLFKVHHSMTDGLGLIQLLELVHSRRPEPSSSDTAARSPSPLAQMTPTGLVAKFVRDQCVDAPELVARRATATLHDIARVARDPAATVSKSAAYIRSLRRVLAPPSTSRSELLRGKGGVGNRVAIIDVPLPELRGAAKTAGVSVNDAFLAAVLGGMRAYHDARGVRVDRLPIAFPISLRKDDDPLGGNQFAAARFAAPLAERDPVARMHEIRDFVREARAEPAIGSVDVLAPAMTMLPTSVIIELTARLTTSSDLQISNIRGVGHPLYIAGARIEGMYPVGPRPGVAAMITMITYNGRCCIGLNVDRDTFPDTQELERCMTTGFAEVQRIGEQD